MEHLKFIPLLYLLLFPQLTFATEQPEYSLNMWASTGQTKWRHDATTGHPHNGYPTSELDYKELKSTVLEFRIGQTLQSGYDLDITLGGGFIKSGLLVDDDYLSATGADDLGASQSGNHRYSRTHSDIDDSGLFYFTGKISPPDIGVSNNRYDLQFNLSFHYWYEEYNAYGLSQIECTTLDRCDVVGTTGFSGINVITNKVQWFGMGAGVNFDINVISSLVYYLDFTFYPVMALYNEDIHHLKSSVFAQNPSISMDGIGTGLDLMTGVRLAFTEKASLHIGYRYWQRHVQDQTLTFHYPGGSSASYNLIDFKTTRDGLVVGYTQMF